MDAIIQGVTQSAISQKLSETEHNAKRFINDLSDNAPYRSFSKEEVTSYMGQLDAPTAQLRFRVPRHGYLNRMYLKVRVYMTAPPNSPTVDPTDDGAKPRGPEFFGGFFQSASLCIGGKCLETLFPENILFEAYKSNGPAAERVLYDMKGVHKFNSEAELGDLGFDVPRAPTGIPEQSYANFLIPLNFSLLAFHKDALDTKFLQQIDVVFNKQAIPLTQGSGSYTRASLVCKYHELHPHFKNQVRNANFSRDTSTLITNDALRLHAVPEVTQIPSTATFPAFGRYDFPIQIDAYVTDILISFRKVNPIDPDLFTSFMQPSPSKTGFLRFVLKAQGRVLLDRQHWEMDATPLNTSGHDIQDTSIAHNSRKFYGLSSDTQLKFVHDDINFPKGVLPLAGRYGNVLYRIPLALFSTDEFLSGGLNFNTLTDVRLIVEGDGLTPAVSTLDYLGLEPVVVFRHKTLTRVDGKTGAVAV